MIFEEKMSIDVSKIQEINVKSDNKVVGFLKLTKRILNWKIRVVSSNFSTGLSSANKKNN